MPPTSNLSLGLSLLFGFGQVVVGGGLAFHGMRRGRWRRIGVFVSVLVGGWFVCSGLTELFVSGMEAAYLLGGAPGPVTFALWRGRADGALLVASVLLALAGLAGVVVLRVRPGAQSGE